MPAFSFSDIKKVLNKKATRVAKQQYEILEKDIQGVVVIDLTANYYVRVDDINNNTFVLYPIKTECYDCKGKRRIYWQGLDDKKKICEVRSKEESIAKNNQPFLPFAAGLSVSGNIVLNKKFNIKVFNIKKTFEDYSNPIAHDACVYYREHYKEINIKIKEKYNVKSNE